MKISPQDKKKPQTLWQRFIEGHNRLSDQAFVWFPFLFLKPPQSQKISQFRILAMTACFSLYGVLFMYLRTQFLDGYDWEDFWSSLIYFPVGFFIWFQVVTAPLWNIRARSLKN